MPDYRTVEHPPRVFRLAKWLNRKDLPGGYWLINRAAKLGLLNTTVRYSLTDNISLDVPLYRAANRWDKARHPRIRLAHGTGFQ